MFYIRIVFFTVLAALLIWAALHTPEQVQQMKTNLFGFAIWLLPVTLLCFIAWAALATIHRFRNRRR